MSGAGFARIPCTHVGIAGTLARNRLLHLHVRASRGRVVGEAGAQVAREIVRHDRATKLRGGFRLEVIQSVRIDDRLGDCTASRLRGIDAVTSTQNPLPPKSNGQAVRRASLEAYGVSQDQGPCKAVDAR